MRLPKSFLQAMKDNILKDNKLGNIASKETRVSEQLPESNAGKDDIGPVTSSSPDERREDEADDGDHVPVATKETSDDIGDHNHKNKENIDGSNRNLNCNEVFELEKGKHVSDDRQQEKVDSAFPPNDEEIQDIKRNPERENDRDTAFENHRIQKVKWNYLPDEGNETGLNEIRNGEQINSCRQVEKSSHNGDKVELLKSNSNDEELNKYVSKSENEMPIVHHTSSSNRIQDSKHSDDALPNANNEQKDEIWAEGIVAVSTTNQLLCYKKDTADVQDPHKLEKDILFEKNHMKFPVDEGDLPEFNTRILVRDSIDGTFGTKEENIAGTSRVPTARTWSEVCEESERGRHVPEDSIPESPIMSPKKSANERPLHRNDSNDSRVSECSNSKESVGKRRTRSGSEQHTSKTLSVLRSFFDSLDRRKLQRHLSESNDTKVQNRIADHEAVIMESDLPVQVDMGSLGEHRESRVTRRHSLEHFTHHNRLGSSGESDKESVKIQAVQNMTREKVRLIEPSVRKPSVEKNFQGQIVNGSPPLKSPDSRNGSKETERDDLAIVGNLVVDDNSGARNTSPGSICASKNTSENLKLAQNVAKAEIDSLPPRAEIHTEEPQSGVDFVSIGLENARGSINERLKTEHRDSDVHNLDSKVHGNIGSEAPANDFPHILELHDRDHHIHSIGEQSSQGAAACEGEALPFVKANRSDSSFDAVDARLDPMLVSKNVVFQSIGNDKSNFISHAPQVSTAESSDMPMKRHTISVDNFHVDVKTTNNLVPFVTTNLLDEGKEIVERSSSGLVSSRKNSASSGVVFKITIERSSDIEKQLGGSCVESKDMINGGKPGFVPKQIVQNPGEAPLYSSPEMMEYDTKTSEGVISDMNKSKSDNDSRALSEKNKRLANVSSNGASQRVDNNRNNEVKRGLDSDSKGEAEFESNNRIQVNNHVTEKRPRPPQGRATGRPVTGRYV